MRELSGTDVAFTGPTREQIIVEQYLWPLSKGTGTKCSLGVLRGGLVISKRTKLDDLKVLLAFYCCGSAQTFNKRTVNTCK